MLEERSYKKIDHPSAWIGETLQNSDVWLTELTDEQIAELDTALVSVKAQEIGAQQINPENFVLPEFGGTLHNLAKDIESGRGFCLIRGLPLDRWGEADSALVYFGISSYLGQAVSQNRKGQILVPIRNTGRSAADPDARGPETNAEGSYHSDFADIVGLMCMCPAKEGGISRICSSIAIYNKMVDEGRTDLIDALFAGYPFYRKNEQKPGLPAYSQAPIPMLSVFDQILSFRVISGWSRMAAETSGIPWSDIQAEAADFIETTARDPKYHLNMGFKVGDVQFLNNYAVLHSRTGYTDYPEPERRRFLQRIWLKAHLGRTLAEDFDHLFGPESTREGIPGWEEANSAGA